MLEQLNLNLTFSKTEYKKQLPLWQANLYDLEHEVFMKKIPTIIVFEGWAAAGKGSTINALSERLDPRGCRVVPVSPPRTSETRFPWLHRFWLKIPARGQMAIMDTSWYRRVLIERVNKEVKRKEWEQAYQDIAEFEETLAAEGTLILKFWLHISQAEQGKRFKKLRKDKLTRWQVSAEDQAQHKKYDKYLAAVEMMLARTNSPHAPWVVVEAHDKYYTRQKVYETLIRALEVRLGGEPAPAPKAATPKEVRHA